MRNYVKELRICMSEFEQNWSRIPNDLPVGFKPVQLTFVAACTGECQKTRKNLQSQNAEQTRVIDELKRNLKKLEKDMKNQTKNIESLNVDFAEAAKFILATTQMKFKRGDVRSGFCVLFPDCI